MRRNKSAGTMQDVATRGELPSGEGLPPAVHSPSAPGRDHQLAARLRHPVLSCQLYLSDVANMAPLVLPKLLANVRADKNATPRIEQIIQDFLRAAFLPFVGQWAVPGYIEAQARSSFRSLQSLAGDVQSQELGFNFVGAHYRSPLSVRGRRTAFASRPAVFHESLQTLLGRKLFKQLREWHQSSVFQQLWDSIYLEQYFRLCGVSTTLSEWALQRHPLSPVAVLVTDGRSCRLTHQTVAADIEVAVVEVPASLSRQLLGTGSMRSLWQTVARALSQTVEEQEETFRHLGTQTDSEPGDEALQNWRRLTRRANTLATNALDAGHLRAQLAARAAYVTGLLLYESDHRPFRDALIQRFALPEPRHKHRRRQEPIPSISEFVRVLQSLQLYQESYGQGCITIPYDTEPFLRGSMPITTRGEPVSRCSVTLFWNPSRPFPPALPSILSAASGLFSQAVGVAERSVTKEPLATVGTQPSTLLRLAAVLENESNGAVSASAIARVLACGQDLARCLHEGEPRAFTFLLGSAEWLVADLQIEHELVGSANPLRLAARGENPTAYESTLALLAGNSSFLQADDLALFIALPGRPLEVTHIVRIAGSALPRKKLVCQFTMNRPSLLAVLTHGNGKGEVVHRGRVRGILREGHSWREELGYDAFEATMKRHLGAVVIGDRLRIVAAKLPPVIRDLSETPGVGALIVVAKEDAISALRQDSSRLTDVLESVDGRMLQEMSPEVLYQLTRDDGATLICGKSLRVWGRRHLPNGVVPGLEARWTEDGPLRWPHWYKTKKWGTRRRTALAVSHTLGDDGVVIAISADGPIDVLRGGRGVAEFNEADLLAFKGST